MGHDNSVVPGSVVGAHGQPEAAGAGAAAAAAAAGVHPTPGAAPHSNGSGQSLDAGASPVEGSSRDAEMSGMCFGCGGEGHILGVWGSGARTWGWGGVEGCVGWCEVLCIFTTTTSWAHPSLLSTLLATTTTTPVIPPPHPAPSPLPPPLSSSSPPWPCPALPYCLSPCRPPSQLPPWQAQQPQAAPRQLCGRD